MIPYEESVFVNCPFDEAYRPLFRGLVFAVHDCGFQARCALEVDESGMPRIYQLYRLIAECRFGIHDLSRTELNQNGLPRFNMPFELGVFLGAMEFGDDGQRQKVCKILDSAPYRYQEFLSDIAGQDPSAHDGDVEQAIIIVRNWLQANQRHESIMPSGSIIAERYRSFQKELPLICEPRLDHDDLTFLDFRQVVETWLEANDFSTNHDDDVDRSAD